MVKFNVHIEGHSDNRLRMSFQYLLANKENRNDIAAKMCKTKDSTIKSYKASKEVNKYLLIDLDTTEDKKVEVLRKHNLEEDKNVYFMVQMCESWFLSQPHIMDEFYKPRYQTNFDETYKQIDSKAIKNPKKKIDDALKNVSNNKRKYEEINDALYLLKKLNIEKLKSDFSDVNNLINALSN